LIWKFPPILATGAELKNAFCLTREVYAFLSHHIGDLENYETLCAFEEGIHHYERLFRVRPETIAYDLHPDYLATRYALNRSREEGIPTIGLQHHFAHIVSCMAENNHPGDRPVIGVSFDGTGYGVDGAIWGGEFLLADYLDFRRVGHLEYVPLPGGEKAINEPWRIALSWLAHAGIEWEDDLPPVHHVSNLHSHSLEILQKQLSSGINAPLTSSAGRLFDAVASLIGLRQEVNYEAQAAIELEMAVDHEESGIYTFELLPRDPTSQSSSNFIVGVSPVIEGLVRDIRQGEPVHMMAARFHYTVAQIVLNACRKIRCDYGVEEVILSGGVWQNMTLLKIAYQCLSGDGFKVILHHQVPANDGGLALGQAVIAGHRLRS
jgi:hydrogenase maturation protein HypF